MISSSGSMNTHNSNNIDKPSFTALLKRKRNSETERNIQSQREAKNTGQIIGEHHRWIDRRSLTEQRGIGQSPTRGLASVREVALHSAETRAIGAS
jgi:hypothetical protein